MRLVSTFQFAIRNLKSQIRNQFLVRHFTVEHLTVICQPVEHHATDDPVGLVPFGERGTAERGGLQSQ